jgi:hypothetical protein
MQAGAASCELDEFQVDLAFDWERDFGLRSGFSFPVFGS